MRDILTVVEGDIVVCTGNKNKSTSDEGSSAGWEKNLCYKVGSVSIKTKTHYVAFPSEGAGVWTDQLRFATEEEISEYKSKGESYTVSEYNLKDVLDDLDKKIALMEKRQHGKV